MLRSQDTSSFLRMSERRIFDAELVIGEFLYFWWLSTLSFIVVVLWEQVVLKILVTWEAWLLQYITSSK